MYELTNPGQVVPVGVHLNTLIAEPPCPLEQGWFIEHPQDGCDARHPLARCELINRVYPDLLLNDFLGHVHPSMPGSRSST